jgi:hypothetical protein
MAQIAQRRRARASQNRGGSILGLIAMIVLVFGGLFYGYRAFTIGEWNWWDSTFAEQPQQIVIIDRGERIEVSASDPLFAELTDALNRSISAGYRFTSTGLSDPTWERMERDGVMVEAIYREPVKLRGGVQPTERLLLLLGGENIWAEQALFRSNADRWDRNPLAVNTVDPVREVLRRHGIGQ